MQLYSDDILDVAFNTELFEEVTFPYCEIHHVHLQQQVVVKFTVFIFRCLRTDADHGPDLVTSSFEEKLHSAAERLHLSTAHVGVLLRQ
jgi:hypothetical protein